ncbi:MAG: PhzF family phenazine biosynthesis protein [Bacillota bacterium]
MKYYVVDAFADAPFHGNPAGVCLPDKDLTDELMQSIAFENNLSETAFVVPREGYYDLRWFTPEAEVDLCGHATLASAFVLMNFVDPSAQRVEFHSQSGPLFVSRSGDLLTLDFPSRPPMPCEKPEILERALGVPVLETHRSRDVVALVADEYTVQTLSPDFALLKQIDTFAVVVTAKGNTRDFVSRFFTPQEGINEDPVTGSSHSTLIPFWSARLGKTKMIARQLSQRGGQLFVEDCGERVKISGRAVCYLKGEIEV